METESGKYLLTYQIIGKISYTTDMVFNRYRYRSGKTVVSSALLQCAGHQGYQTVGYKPVASGSESG